MDAVLRRVHAVLLHRRWQDTRAARVDFALGGTDFPSASHRNMGRTGTPADSTLLLAADGLTGGRTVLHLAAPQRRPARI
jgi:hypothetical protein